MNDTSYDPEMQDNQIVAVYETRAAAERARDQLVAAGVARSEVEVHAEDATTGDTTRSDGPHDEGFWGSLKNIFAPDDEYRDYHTAIERGHAMVVVTASGSTDRHKVIQLLEQGDPLDVDEKVAEWRASESATGATTPQQTLVTGHSPPAMGAGPTGSTAAAPGTAGMARPAEDVDTIKVVQERLRVGKREVAGGAVRVRSYVVERPVEEQVRLHSERVTVDRRPVDRALAGNEEALFTERTLEAASTSEEALVQKEARVVEEIGLHREASDRTETVRDSVRETKVEVEDGTNTARGTQADSPSRPAEPPVRR